MVFQSRFVSVTFRMGQGGSFSAGGDVLTLSNHRILSRIVQAGGPSGNTAELQIFGMRLTEMNELSTLGQQILFQPRNTLSISAGSDPGNLAVVFIGTIMAAWFDGGAMPQTPFRVMANAGVDSANAPPQGSRGETPIAGKANALANALGLLFENNGVSSSLTAPYLWGSAREQMQQLADAGNFNWTIDKGTLAIWPKGGSRSPGSIPVISPQTGMIRYPTFTANGIMLSTIFNPAITFGGVVEVQSSILRAQGTQWYVHGLDHYLDAQQPRGNWHSVVQVYSLTDRSQLLSIK